MEGNALHGGAPTAVINASLYGAVREAGRHPQIGCVYGALGGSGAVIAEKFLDLKTVPGEELELLLSTPSSAIGTSRDHLEPEDYRAIAAEEGIERAATDYVSGMTDKYVMDVYSELFIPKSWQVR